VSKVIKAVTDSGSNVITAFKEFSKPLLVADPVVTIIGCEEGEDGNSNDPTLGEIVDFEFISVSTIIGEQGDQDIEDETRTILPPHHPCSSHKLNLIGSADANKSKAS